MNKVTEREFYERQYQTLKDIGNMICENEEHIKEISNGIEVLNEKYNELLIRRRVLEKMSEETAKLEYNG